MEESANQLLNIFLCLLATLLAVPGARKLGFGPVLGYLVAGVFIGPWGLAVIRETEEIRLLVDVTIVVMLFLIGFELQPSVLLRLWRSVILRGVLLWSVTVVLLFMVGMTVGLKWQESLSIAVALAFSSNALTHYFMREKNLSGSMRGESVLSMLLAQSLLLFPLLVLVPLLGFGSPVQETGFLQIVKVVVVSALVFFVGRLAQQQALRYLSSSQLPDMFAAFSLFLVMGVILLMSAIGSSVLLGAYVAGCLMAGSEFRQQLESSIEPFRGLLVGLFFVSLGLVVDFGLLLQYPHIVLAVLIVLVVIKIAVIVIAGYFSTTMAGQQWLPAVLLAPAGELAFVILSVAISYQALTVELGSGMIVVLALSMLITPMLQVFYDRRVVQSYDDPGSVDEAGVTGSADGSNEGLPQRAPTVVIAGFGRVGQVVGRLLMSAGIRASVVDYDPLRLAEIKRFGFSVYCGDVMRLELLELAGLADAKVLVVAVDDWRRIRQLADMVHSAYPQVKVVARSRDRLHHIELVSRGVGKAHRETFESAMLMGEDVLNSLGIELDETERIAEAFRDHDERLLFEDIERSSLSINDSNRVIESAIENTRENTRGTDEGASWSEKVLPGQSAHQRSRAAVADLMERDQTAFEKERQLKMAGD